MRAYVVTENEFDKELIESLLARRFGKSAREICVRAADSKLYAWSGACSLLTNRRIPTALIVDADTIDDDLTEEQRTNLDYLFATSAPRHMWLIVLAQPEVEAVFVSDRALLERATGKKVSELDVARAALGPRAALQKLLPKPRSGHGAKQMVKKLSAPDFETVISSVAFRPLIEFIQRQLSAKEPPRGIQRTGEKSPNYLP
ncbi:hypothetical protein [Vitiosangium sp. GDMCC 1.1324]|uniref:hypothetical protein n=1 Tax=Vitiosangium sp. (strain GDMCC 1.1324) TaxID=2138576 RepID=UPI000D3D8943|nr:hypothetical protein [Vitiosangium sp. GDMCC 1.1324]PTL85327.1 hypothetical protein DAT35_00980 [Vitiosangium sp. GDMCC 1.1324]